jgi:hypothetical protein
VLGPLILVAVAVVATSLLEILEPLQTVAQALSFLDTQQQTQ